MDISNRMRSHLLLICLLIPCLAVSAQEPFEFRDGDRVVFLGSTLMEREGNYGYIETFLTRRFPHKSLTFRNLGYSAETVLGESRAMFDTPKEGFQRMVDQVVEASPTVIFLAFGSNAAYQGEEGLSGFLEDYAHLVEILEGSTEARFVVLSPPTLENCGPPLPDPADQNARVEIYADAIQKFAEGKEFDFIDLFHPLLESYEKEPQPHWTDNSIHFNPYGYWRLALLLGDLLGIGERDWKVVIDLERSQFDGSGTRFDSIRYSASGGLELLLTDRTLPIPDPPIGSRSDFQGESLPYRTLFVDGLSVGQYELRVGESPMGTFSSQQLTQGISIPLGPQEGQVERLRKTIEEKSRLFFYRWRPQNWTYLYGFRKHEQGQNAQETPMFDPLIEELEDRISQLRIPEAYRVELVPIQGGTQ